MEIITGQEVDRVIQEVISRWCMKFPNEVLDYEERMVAQRQFYEYGATLKGGNGRFLGAIPPRVRAALNTRWPGFWQDPESIRRFFRVYTDMAYGSKPKYRCFMPSKETGETDVQDS